MKVVIDTNVLISSFLGRGAPRSVIDLWKQGRITICLSMPIVEEYTGVLARLGLSRSKELDELIQLFARGYYTVFVANPPKINLLLDDKDDIKFFECAASHKAKYIISGDKKVLAVESYFDIKVVSPADFLKIIEK